MESLSTAMTNHDSSSLFTARVMSHHVQRSFGAGNQVAGQHLKARTQSLHKATTTPGTISSGVQVCTRQHQPSSVSLFPRCSTQPPEERREVLQEDSKAAAGTGIGTSQIWCMICSLQQLLPPASVMCCDGRSLKMHGLRLAVGGTMMQQLPKQLQ